MLDAKVHEQLLLHTDKELEILENKPGFNPVFFKRLEGDFYRDRHIFIEKHTRFIAVPMHSHDFIELVYVYSGTMRQVVNGKSVELKAGEMLLLNQYAQHEIDVTGENDIIINFIIEADYIARLISLFDDENLITKFILSSINGKNKSGEHVHFKVSHDQEIQNSVCKIINEIYSDKVLKQMRVHFLVGLLITDLLSNVDNSDYYVSSNYVDSLALTVLKYIDENFQDASLKVIADKINQPNYKVSRLLKSYTGKTFSELVIEKRIERAIYLLKYTDHSIIDVINMTGYENASHFYRVFKDKYNVSVKEYRDSVRSNDEIAADC
ncbi:TPA: helix-turn-helix domain-containing protein [Vibrio parahaemolyticus]|uniref:AraC family transcriptional regulator n=1 Tax=Vibrio parahaemolyticus TaxID=670 RepID=UPI00087119E4|nr:AraC family transcriptional regulator [Vibrio parahaemolyticus]AOV91858.1 Cupin domain protein [Vibrio parahaemolyticus]EGR2695855.1 AraC family transcriptional regulator [Vibrio parahaemolyticus]HCG8157835.1 helix-turn-helix domain-containing protein [Vibrio parahaemolyticus]